MVRLCVVEVRSMLIAIMMCMACAGSSPASKLEHEEVLTVLPPSTEDKGNRYAAVVVLARQGTERPYCTGVLIGSRLVLTAAHCVCGVSGDGGALVMKPSTCRPKASLMTALYRQPGTSGSDTLVEYEGDVVPHPEFKVILQDKEVEVSDRGTGSKSTKIVRVVKERTADLAMVRLPKPLAGGFVPVSLADGDVDVDDAITIVGFGADEIVNGQCRYNDTLLTRRFGDNTVAEKDGSEKIFRIKLPGSLSACGDSGGPCLRNKRLVGIISTAVEGERTTVTSTHHYREWINKVIQETDKI